MTKEFQGRNIMARDAVLTVQEHTAGRDGWVRLQVQHASVATPFFMRRSDAPALALELLQLAGDPGMDPLATHLKEYLAEQDRQAARQQEDKELRAEAADLWKAGQPHGEEFDRMAPDVQERYMRIASRARHLAVERASKAGTP